MGSIYKRGKVWWLAFLDSSGKRVLRSSGVRDERLARQALESIESSISAQDRITNRPLTVAAWVEKWSAERKNWNKKGDLGMLKKHVLPALGSKRLVDVAAEDVRLLVGSWTTHAELSPRYVRNIFWVMSRVFSDAVRSKLIDTTPCLLVRGDRPKIRDGNRNWRKTAIFTQAEAEQLLSADEVPADRHVVWALGFLGALRLGEVSALRWRDYDTARAPLGCLSISSSYTRINGEEKATKTETPRDVPVHPTLAAMLAEWKLAGWPEMFGRKPSANDLIVPNRAGRHITDNNVQAGRTQDFKALQMRPRRFHDSRRTFISLAQAGGASKDVLQLVTHGSPGEVMDLYTTLPWPTLCQAVLCLNLTRRRAAPVALLQPLLQSPESPVQPTDTTTSVSVPKKGFEPVFKGANRRDAATSSSADGVVLPPPQHQLDGDRSNVATGRALPRRAWREPAIRTLRGREVLALLAGGAA